MARLPVQPLAIVGIGCRLPGNIEDPTTLWAALAAARDTIIEIPESRWSGSAFHHVDAAVRGASYSRWAGLVERPEDFDAAFFGITPREAQRLDPQQRWLLEVSWRALEDAGQRIEDLRRSSIGVYVGCSSSDYGDIQRRGQYQADLHTNTGSAVSLIANRVSYAFDLHGPSLVVDTACSSSLVALDIAARAIRDGQCDAAIVGGVNALFMPDLTVGFSKASMLARDGRCKAFDARADGYVRAEGAVALFIKPLERAVSEGDRIYASILSTSVNQDGQTPGITMPSRTHQLAMLEAAYDGVVDPGWVGAVEAHGTGTPVGDPIEAHALGRMLGRGRSRENALLIGSIKTNIGHLEPASGAAGLAKLALSLHHRKVAPNLHFQSGNPEIDFTGLGLRVATAMEDWPVAPDGRLYGGVNSFGFGGTNAHAVLSSPPARSESTQTTVGPIIWPLSARSIPALHSIANETRALLRDINEPELRRRSVAQSRRRTAHAYRHAIVAEDPGELIAKLETLDPAKTASRIGERASGRLFIFSGQGSQWHGMARDLADAGPEAAEIAQRIAGLMPTVAGRPLLDALREPDPDHDDRTDVIQPLLFVQQLMLAAQLESWGIKADAVCGHSVGEIAAAYWAGSMTLEHAVEVVFHRSRLQEKTRWSGAMAAVGVSPAAAEEWLSAYRDIHIAAVNSPEMITLAGDRAELDRLCVDLTNADVFVHRLSMPYAFHSPHMDGLHDDLLVALGKIAPREGRLPFFSTVSGGELTCSALNAEYWWQNLRNPVRFRDAVTAATLAGYRSVVELGPHPSLLRAAADCATAVGQTLDLLTTLQRGRSAPRALAEMLGQTWSQGFEPDWSAVYPGQCTYASLPGHPWQRESHWLEAPAVRAYRIQPIEHPLLGRCIYGPGARWEQLIDLARLPDFADHRIRGDIVFPAAAYVEQMLALGHALFGDVPLAITHLELDQMLTLDRARMVQIERDETSARTQICSEPDVAGEPWVRHAQARLLPSAGELTGPTLPSDDNVAPLSIEDLYRRFDEGGNRYGPRFRCLREMRSDGQQAWGRIALDPQSLVDAHRFRFHPALLDAALQMVLELLRIDGHDELYVPVGVDRIEVNGTVGSDARCLVRNAHRRDGLLRADIYIYGDDNRPIVSLEGCRCRAIETSSVGRSSAQALLWVWESSAAERVAPGHSTWRVLGFTDAEAAELGTHVGNDRVRSLDDPAPVTGTLVCWFRSTSGERMDGAGAAALELARLVQRLAGSNVRLHLVTEGATWGHSDGSEINFDAAAVWALGRSLITERPVAISGMTDLEPGTPVAAALGQIGADLRIASEEVAWRGLDRFEHRLQPRPLQQLCERSAPTAQVEGYALSIGERKGFEGLRWRRRAPPQPGVGQMTIAVEACGVNFRDVLKVLDVYPLGRSEWRWLGDEFAGRVHEVGPGVEGFAAGDLVVGVAPDCMASHVLADARLVARCPPSLSPELAAGVPIAFLTAWYSLVECGRLKRGETVLIHAAAGGVGQAAIQIARHLGARVLATASPAKQALVASLGADAVFNSRDLSFAEAARGATSGEGVDLVLNSLAGDALIHSVDLLKPFGRFIELGKRDIFANRPLDLRSLRDNRRFFTVDLASWMMRSPEEAGRQLGEVLQLIERGELRPVETHVLPIRTAAETFRGMAQGQHTGKLVLRVQGETAPLRVGDPEAKIVRPDATYLITGGTSGLGLVVARFLAKAGARHLVLSSRSGNVAESDAPVLDEILNYGATVHLRACDIGDVRATKGLLAEIRRDLPPLRGVVHGAMVLDDVDILGLDLARLDRVLRPKAMGAWNLSVLTEGDGLDWFLMHGSVSAMLGAAGQSNYVVANHLLEALVAHRQRRGLPAQTVAWGPIASAGVVARSDQLRRYFELLGFTRLTNDSIEDALNHLLCSDESAIAVCGVDWVRLSAALPGFESDKRFRHLLDAARENDGGTNMAEMLNTLDVAGRRELVANLIVVQTATVLGIQTAQVPRDRPLGDLGLDSLMAFELSATLEANLGKRLPISTLQGNRTVDELADRISRVFAGNGEIPPEQQSASSQSGVAAAGKAAGVRLRFLAPRSLADPDMRFEAAALTYIPEDFITRGNLGTTELRAAFGAEPFLSCVIDGPIGRVGAFMLPVRGRDLFSEPSRTRELVYRSMQLAQSQGSRVMTLTGLLPAATDYGQALGLNNGHAMDMAVTTGHALTTATIVANLADLLQRCGRQVEGEEISIVGLGSVGRSVLELLLRSLPHPRKLVLCDRYAKVSDLEVLRRQIRAKHNFDGPIDLVAGDNGLPEEVLGTKLIVSAVDRTGLIDPMRLGSGTILLDDSYPPAFELKTAWRRMEEGQDVVIASGGFARLSGVVQETLYVPDSARGFLDSYGEENFLRLFEREACDYTACVFAGPLSLRDPALHPALGIPTAEALEAFHAALDRHRIGSAKPHCGGQLLPESLFVKMRDIQKLPEGSRPEFRI